MAVLPFVLLGDGQLAAARALLAALATDWGADWGVGRDGLLLECRRAWEARASLPAAPTWQACWQGAGGALWLAWPGELPGQLQRTLFGPERQAGLRAGGGAGTLAASCAGAAWQDLCARLGALAGADAVAGDGHMPPAAHWRHTSGAVLLTVRLGKQLCHGLLDGAAVQALLEQARLRGRLPARPVRSPLAALDYAQVLAAVAVRLPVALGQAQVALGSLAALAVGDVIRLDRAADRPLAIAAPSGPVLFGAYLGTVEQRLALELVPQES